MHIVFLIPGLDRIGGAEKQVVLLAKGLSRRGWRVSVIALSGKGDNAAAELRSNGANFYSLHMRKGIADLRGWILLHGWIRRNRPDVIHAHLPQAVLMARWSRFFTPIRVLVETIHSPATGGAMRKCAYRASVQQPDLVTAVSRAGMEPWLTEGMVRRSSLTVLANGIDPGEWIRNPQTRSATRSTLGFDGDFVWLTLGRLELVKDHANLLHAFAALPEKARLVIAGAGSLEHELRSLAAELRVDGRVLFPGFQRDVLPWLHAADAFVLSSKWEGLPLALLEAVACELPAVCTDVPAMRELELDRSDLPLAPVGNSNALADAMKATMGRSEEERLASGRRVRRSILERFTLSSVLNRWEEMYRNLLAMKPLPTRSGLQSQWCMPEAFNFSNGHNRFFESDGQTKHGAER